MRILTVQGSAQSSRGLTPCTDTMSRTDRYCVMPSQTSKGSSKGVPGATGIRSVGSCDIVEVVVVVVPAMNMERA